MGNDDAYLRRWRELCHRYLPVRPADGIWRMNRGLRPDDPEQGWKLHLSATVLTASEMLEKAAPLLSEAGVLFKAPASLREVSAINAGLEYGYSQVGKVLTVYPRNAAEAVALASRLHDLTVGMAAPRVPFDRRFREASCVYYRYGAFRDLDLVTEGGKTVPALRRPDGALVPDSREAWETDFPWLSDPFAPLEEPVAVARGATASPFATRFRVIRAVSQRGRGGVYQAVDVGVNLPRLCVLKEGRRHGETGLDGSDGAQRVRHEANVLCRLRALGIEVPALYAAFEVEDDAYVAMEHIQGETLHAMLRKRQRRLSLSRVVALGVRIATLISRLHAVGWAWRDCKPGNLVVTSDGNVRPIDFESACLLGRPTPRAWETPEFASPRRPGDFAGTCSMDDLYSLGAILYLLLTGRVPAPFAAVPADQWRNGIPGDLLALLAELLSPEPECRPVASIVARRLEAFLPARSRGESRASQQGRVARVHTQIVE